MALIGGALTFFGIIVGITAGGSATAFLNLPAALFVLSVGCGIVVAAHGPGVCSVLRQALAGTLADSDVNDARLAAITARQAFLAAGWIGLIVGIVQLLSSLDDPSKIGVGLATALLSVLYAGIAAYVIWLPLERRLTEPGSGTTDLADRADCA